MLGNEVARLPTPANLRMATKIGCISPRHTQFGCGCQSEAERTRWKGSPANERKQKGEWPIFQSDPFSVPENFSDTFSTLLEETHGRNNYKSSDRVFPKLQEQSN